MANKRKEVGWTRLEPGASARLEAWSFRSTVLPEPASRQISVYLPEGYGDEPDRRYPVFYLHDGQNVFDPTTSYVPGRTWHAGETADYLAREGKAEAMILVGVANTGLRRMAEYTPTRDYKLGGGEGRSYGRLLVEELKPLVDGAYRTLTGPAETAVGGSSLGGLISLYLGLEYPQIFGKLAVMSPSIWWDHRAVLSLVQDAKPRPELQVWLDIGTAEGMRHVRDTELLHRLMVQRGWVDGVGVKLTVEAGAVHDEGAWAGRFGGVLEWLFPRREHGLTDRP